MGETLLGAQLRQRHGKLFGIVADVYLRQLPANRDLTSAARAAQAAHVVQAALNEFASATTVTSQLRDVETLPVVLLLIREAALEGQAAPSRRADLIDLVEPKAVAGGSETLAMQWFASLRTQEQVLVWFLTTQGALPAGLADLVPFGDAETLTSSALHIQALRPDEAGGLLHDLTALHQRVQDRIPDTPLQRQAGTVIGVVVIVVAVAIAIAVWVFVDRTTQSATASVDTVPHLSHHVDDNESKGRRQSTRFTGVQAEKFSQ